MTMNWPGLVKFLQVKWKRFRAGICTLRSWPMAATCLYGSQGRPRNPSRKTRKRVSFTCLFEVDEWCIEWEIHSVCGLGNSHVTPPPLTKSHSNGKIRNYLAIKTSRDVISWDDFQTFSINLWCNKFHPPEYDNELASQDPLWHCWPMLKHFQKNSASHAVPVGSSALDENACRMNGRTRAKRYMPMNTICFGKLILL